MLETMDSGEILYLGKKAVWSDESGKLNYADKKELKEIQSQYGLVFQNFNLFPHFSVLKNITDAPSVCRNAIKKRYTKRQENF